MFSNDKSNETKVSEKKMKNELENNEKRVRGDSLTEVAVSGSCNNMGNFPQPMTSILTKQLIVRKEFFEKKFS